MRNIIGFAERRKNKEGDVAFVHDGSVPQTNIVDVNGARAVLMTIQKTGQASTLDIINHIKKLMTQVRDSMPPPSGTRVEETEKITGQVDKIIHEVIPEKELDSLVDNTDVLAEY